MTDALVLSPTSDPRVFVAPDGRRLTPPHDWSCLPPGDAGLTRRVKAAGPSWQVVERRGRKQFSRGLWAPTANVEAARAAIEAERSTEAYARRLTADRARRDRAQVAYVAAFEQEVRASSASRRAGPRSASAWPRWSRPTRRRSAAAPWRAPSASRSIGAPRPR
jgi:hypothetical protein